MDRKVSIITPTYNHERFIAQCIESALAQTYGDWEMIVVDDGSGDATWEIVQSLAARDRRIRAFRQANKGIWRLAETYNFALSQSQGDLLAVLEGDDLWVPSKLETQIPFHVQGGHALSFGQTGFVDARGVSDPREVYPDSKRLAFLRRAEPNDLLLRLLRGEFFLPAVTVMLSRQPLVEIGGFQQPRYLPVVDYPTWLPLAVADGGVGFVSAVLGQWRQYETQATWLLSGEIARGVYQYALDFARPRQAALGIPGVALERFLLSRERRAYLADAYYRAAAIWFERGDSARAWAYWRELAALGDYRQLAKCLAMFGWKLGRRAIGAARRLRVGVAR